MKFERGQSIKKALGIGLSYDNLQRGTILEITKGFSVTKWGEINNHMDAFNKFYEGRFIVIRTTPVYGNDGKISFRFRNAYNEEQARRAQEGVLSKPEERGFYSRMQIYDMSRLQFNRRFRVRS